MKRKYLVYCISVLALLLALIFLFWYGVGTINLGFIAITLSCLPVIIGTMALGLSNGLILALCFASISFFTGLSHPQGLIAPIFSAHVLWGAALCYLPRIMVPVVTHFLYQMVKEKKKALLAVPAAAGSLTNTVLFLGFIIILYGLLGIENAQLLGLIGTTVLVGGLPEAAVAALVCPPVILALRKSHLI
ncbi:MAG: ECF transporter S component [Clostridia bacterium]|nr:ECF transporter S component [Clostridia bacterium]